MSLKCLKLPTRWCLALVLLWIYFFHIALYHTTIALTVSNSYFQGDLQEHHLCPSLGGCFGAPMLVSLVSIFRYHLGSLAFGSLALMICTVGRVVFEYVERHTKDGTKELRQSLAFEKGLTMFETLVIQEMLTWCGILCIGNKQYRR